MYYYELFVQLMSGINEIIMLLPVNESNNLLCIPTPQAILLQLNNKDLLNHVSFSNYICKLICLFAALTFSRLAGDTENQFQYLTKMQWILSSELLLCWF